MIFKRQSPYNYVIILLGIILFRSLPSYSQQPDSVSITQLKIYKLEPTLTEEEYRFYQADYLPLSLAQKGRLFSGAYRGMPAGFINFNFDEVHLDNPVVGFWDEQSTPHFRIQHRQFSPPGYREVFRSQPPGTYKPETNVTYFWSNMSNLDIDFAQYVNKKNYFRLSGNIFLRNGTEPSGYSEIQVNTYQAHFHFKLSERWTLDLHYWHLRHKFNMPPQDFLSFDKDKFKTITRLGWIRLHAQLSEKDSLVIIPTVSYNDDEYKQGNTPLRENLYVWGGASVHYLRKIKPGTMGIQVAGRLFANEAKFNWFDRKESEGSALLTGNLHIGLLGVQFTAGGYRHSESGNKPMATLNVAFHSGLAGAVGVTAFSKPQPMPLLWRTVQRDTIPALQSKLLMEKQGGSFFYKKHFGDWFFFKVEPFAYRTTNYPFLPPGAKNWQMRDVENYGVNVLAGIKIWHFYLQNDFTYNHNYKEAFAPRWNNVGSVKTHFYMFKRALRLEGILVGHVLGNVHQLAFDRLLYQYLPGSAEVGPYYLLDFNFNAQIGPFTLYLVWENILSEDYSIIDGTLEQLRLFRIGVNWLLFD